MFRSDTHRKFPFLIAVGQVYGYGLPKVPFIWKKVVPGNRVTFPPERFI